MSATRRDFLRISGSALAGTAVGALTSLGADLRPKVALARDLRIKDAKVFPSVCPYCAVGCGMLVHVQDEKIVNIEGNPASPINQGNLCPKDAASFQLHVNPNRLTKMLHRRPGGTAWEEMGLDAAMDRVAQLVKKTRDETFVERLPNGKLVNNTLGIFSLGCATMDYEWNHIHQKLKQGLDIVTIENYARI